MEKTAEKQKYLWAFDITVIGYYTVTSVREYPTSYPILNVADE